MSEIKIFEQKQVRSIWNAEEEKWYFSVIDVIEILSGSPRPRKYWNALKTKLKAEGSQLSQNLGQLKLQSADGKFYKTDVADTEQLFRLVQSTPSPKAEHYSSKTKNPAHIEWGFVLKVVCNYSALSAAASPASPFFAATL